MRHQNPERVLRGGLRGVVPAEIGLELAVFALDHDDDGAREDDVAREQDALGGAPRVHLGHREEIVRAGGEDQARRRDAAVALEDRVQLLLREAGDPPAAASAGLGGLSVRRPGGRGSGGGPNEYRISPLFVWERTTRADARALVEVCTLVNAARTRAGARRERGGVRGAGTMRAREPGRRASERQAGGRAAEIRVARQDEDIGRIRRRRRRRARGGWGGGGLCCPRGARSRGDGGGRASAGEATFREGSRVASRGVRCVPGGGWDAR